MKTLQKRFGVMLIVAIYAITLLLSATGLVQGIGDVFDTWQAYAQTREAETNVGATYFYDELNDLSKKFYDVLSDLEKSGEFKDGQVSYNLVENNIVTESDVERYVKGGKTDIPVAFSSARDAYQMENPSLFYIDIYKLVFSAGKQNGKWVALIDTGNYDNCYHDNGFKNETEVNEAISSYNTKLAEAVTTASNGATLREKIALANNWILQNVEYNYEAYDTITNNMQSANKSVALSGTSYGAMVMGTSVCAGYSRAFKAILDKMDIPCVCVQGYSRRPGNDSAEPHMWNYVKMDDSKWYAVDTTWNDTGSTSNGNAKVQASVLSMYAMRYLLVGKNKLAIDHTSDGVVSSSGFELYYPVLAELNYGMTEDTNGFAIDTNYDEYTAEISFLYITASYNGMGAKILEEQGLYMVFRYEFEDWATGEWTTSKWNQVTKYKQYFDGGLEINDDSIVLMCTTQMTNVQFAIFDTESDGMTYGSMHNTYEYNPENLNVANVLVDSSKLICNEAYGTYTPPPYPKYYTPVNTTVHDHGTYNITITYDDQLKIADPSKPIGVRVSTVFNDMEGYYKLENVQFNEEENSVSFRFTPSMMYHHNMAHYSFLLTNIVGVESEKMPVAASYTFSYPVPCYTAYCPRNTSNFTKVYGQPQLLSDENLAESGFESVLGTEHKYNTDQRAQVLLVVSKPDEQQSSDMINMFSDETNVKNGDVKATATYEIDMNVCYGACKSVKDGWKLQLGVGFPYKDFDYTDTSIVYKAYHYKRDANGIVTSIEEISCIVTPLGLIIDVDSFSPFMIVALDSNSDLAKTSLKQIFANKLTDGGKISEKVSGKNNIFQVSDTITYNLQPTDGYKIDKIVLNGKTLDSSLYADNTLTLNESDLNANNTLDVSFIKDSVAERYTENNIELETPTNIVVSDDTILKANATAHSDSYVPERSTDNSDFVTNFEPNDDPNNPDNNENPEDTNPNAPEKGGKDIGTIVAIVISGALGVALIVIVIIVIAIEVRKKKQSNKK